MGNENSDVVYETHSSSMSFQFCLYMNDVNATPDLRCFVSYINSFGFAVDKKDTSIHIYY